MMQSRPPAGATVHTFPRPTGGEARSAALRLRAHALPADLLERATRDGLPGLRARARVTWEVPAQDEALFGIGLAWRATGACQSSLFEAVPVLRSVAADVAVDAAVSGAARPRFFGGSRFDRAVDGHDAAWDPFGGWQFVLPRLLIARVGGEFTGTVLLREDECLEATVRDTLDAPLPRGMDTPPAAQGGLTAGPWQDAVAAAVDEIEQGRYEKVVLARQVRRPSLPSADVLGRLAERHPGCFVFSLRAGESTWLGATPELLVRLDGGVAETASLAGSGPVQAADATGVSTLATDRKIQHEHKVVLDAIVGAIQPLCSDVQVAGEPEVVRLRNIEHLSTPIRADARTGVDILDFVERLHPTPAVGGWPLAPALEALSRLERMDRGWYAGPIGWLDLRGDGEFAVALRSALLTGREATLFAGAGIVEGSVPASEFEETETKLQAMIEALS